MSRYKEDATSWILRVFMDYLDKQNWQEKDANNQHDVKIDNF